jgi:cytochrome o ubiquinol oxidase subunit II
MPGMQTRLHAVINAPGDFLGISANYSGAGFSKMQFRFKGFDQAGFEKWIADAKASTTALDRTAYLELEKPTEAEPVRRWGTVDGKLFELILNMCVEPGKMCAHEMMAIDAKGGLGLASARNVLPLTYDKYARRGSSGPVLGVGRTYVAGICDTDELVRANAAAAIKPGSTLQLLGAGLPRPGLNLRQQSTSELPLPLRPTNS